MNHLLRWSVTVGLVIAGWALASQVQPGFGGNVGNWLQIQQQLAEERRRSEALDHESRRTQQHLEMQLQVIRDLLENRLTLLEAAGRFRDLAHPWTTGNPVFCMAFPGQTEEERFCRQVIAFVRTGGPARLARWARADSLEEELAQRLAQGPLRMGSPECALEMH
jgi:hypothetical protein